MFPVRFSLKEVSKIVKICQELPNPKNLLRLFFGNNLARLKKTSEAKTNLRRLFSLVLKGIFRARLKITLENKNNI